jgi:hypothetical protein
MCGNMLAADKRPSIGRQVHDHYNMCSKAFLWVVLSALAIVADSSEDVKVLKTGPRDAVQVSLVTRSVNMSYRPTA